MKNIDYGEATERTIQEVIDACERYESQSIIALAGVPGTSKSFIAEVAAQRLTDQPLFVRQIQFHPAFSYEQFMEGLRIEAGGATAIIPGVFLKWNQQAQLDPTRRYVLLIEELTRAEVAAVLGEVLTYIEYRDRAFYPIYSQQPTVVAKNLTILATYNPTDQSAINLDDALLRRMRVIPCVPNPMQLREMLKPWSLPDPVIAQLQDLFIACKAEFGSAYEELMPFGHAIFADIRTEDDLYPLWRQRIINLLRRPLRDPHPYAKYIEDHYPWSKPDFRTKK